MELKQLSKGDFIVSMAKNVERSVKSCYSLGASSHYLAIRTELFFLPSQDSSAQPTCGNCPCHSRQILQCVTEQQVSAPYGSVDSCMIGWGVCAPYNVAPISQVVWVSVNRGPSLL